MRKRDRERRKRDREMIRKAQQYARFLKTRNRPVLCPFSSQTDVSFPMGEYCSVCFEWIGLQWNGSFHIHPCCQLPKEEVRKRFWRKP